MLRCGVLTASLLTASVTLHGCGGGDNPPAPGPSPSPSPSPSPRPSPSPIPIPIPPPSPPPLAPCNPLPAENDPVVDELNRLYTSFDAKEPASPTGVTIRMVGSPAAEDARFFCGGSCVGKCDCRVSASLYNSEMMTLHVDKTLAVPKPPTVAVTMSRIAGIIYNQTSVETSLAKCAYMYDAATFGRVNHGCGCASKHSTGCPAAGEQCNETGAPDSAYCNQDCKYKNPSKKEGLIKGSCKNNTEASPDVEKCWCKTTGKRDHDTPFPEDMTTTSQQCFFRGAALASASGPRQMVPSELHDMVIARIANQANPPTEEIVDNPTRIKQEYWNEIVIEGEELRNRLNDNPMHAYSAFIYVGNSLDGKKKAQKMQQDTYAEYGEPWVPIVELDPTVDVRCNGPFRKQSNMPATTVPTTTTTWDGVTCAKTEHAKCGGKGWKGVNCCDNGLVCARQNEWYYECAKPTTTTAEAAPTTTSEATPTTTAEATPTTTADATPTTTTEATPTTEITATSTTASMVGMIV